METVTKGTREAIASEDFEQKASTPQPSLVQELWDFLRYNKKWWLTPIIPVLLPAGLLCPLPTYCTGHISLGLVSFMFLLVKRSPDTCRRA